jgi:hypothetical protein
MQISDQIYLIAQSLEGLDDIKANWPLPDAYGIRPEQQKYDQLRQQRNQLYSQLHRIVAKNLSDIVTLQPIIDKIEDANEKTQESINNINNTSVFLSKAGEVISIIASILIAIAMI